MTILCLFSKTEIIEKNHSSAIISAMAVCVCMASAMHC